LNLCLSFILNLIAWSASIQSGGNWDPLKSQANCLVDGYKCSQVFRSVPHFDFISHCSICLIFNMLLGMCAAEAQNEDRPIGAPPPSKKNRFAAARHRYSERSSDSFHCSILFFCLGICVCVCVCVCCFGNAFLWVNPTIGGYTMVRSIGQAALCGGWSLLTHDYIERKWLLLNDSCSTTSACSVLHTPYTDQRYHEWI
jgi:hypothetical protein